MSFPRYPKYKPSGVEWLPEVPVHWERSALKRLARYENGYPYKPDDRGDVGLPIIRISQLTSDDPPAFFAGDIEQHVPIADGDLLFAWSASIDAYIWNGGSALLNQHIFKVAPRPEVDKRFLFHLIRHAAPKLAEFDAHGSTMRHIKKESLGEVVYLPPLPEQRAIAAFLDRETAKIDGLVDEQRRLIELLKEKRQAVISHAVTKGLDPKAPMKPSGVEWLGDVPAHWEVRRLKTVIRSIEQGWSPQCEGEPAIDGGWGVLKVGCVNGDHFDPEENKAVPEELMVPSNLEVHAGEVLMSRGNTTELVGMAGLVVPSAARLLLSDLLYRVEFLQEGAHAPFAVHLLRSGPARFQIRRDATGTSASMKKIAQSDIRELLLAFPPLPEQRAIAAFLDRETSRIDGLVKEAESAITLLQERRSALISAAVTGQIDVRNAAATEAA